MVALDFARGGLLRGPRVRPGRGRCVFLLEVERSLSYLSLRVCVCLYPEFSSVSDPAVVGCVQK